MPRKNNSRENILDAAAKLFYKNGYKATSVEAIANAANITKATLYHHFSNKDELIEATLTHLSEYHKNGYVQAWNKKGLTPIKRLTVLFDEMADFFKEDECYGCPFINAAGEYTERDSAARKICESHYQFLTNHLEKFACDAGLKHPHLVAEKISSVVAGAYTGWYVGGIAAAARHGKEIATMVIKQHGKKA